MAFIKNVSFKELVTVAAVFVLLLTFMIVGLKNFEGESRGVDAVISHPQAKSADNLSISVKTLTIDPIKGDVSIRAEFLPRGALLNANHELVHDVKVFFPTANGKTEFEFKKGKHMAPVDVTIGLFDGYSSDYPFDSYETLFDIYADQHVGEGESSVWQAIPLEVSFAASVPGYKIAIEKSKETEATFVESTLQVKRSAAVVAFSCFVMVLMWGLSIAVLLMVIVLLFRKQKIEIGLFGFMSALLFAFYGLRNGQPSIPPIGVYSDFVAFFGAEIIVAACLLVITLTWVFRDKA